MSKDIMVPVVAGLFGAVITPLVAQVMVPWLRRMLGIDREPAAAGAAKRRRRKSKSPLWPVAGGVAGVLLGVLVVSPMMSSACPPFAPTGVRITSPAEASTVSRLVTVQGTSCHVPRGQQLWVIVLPQGVSAFYPQTGPVVVSGGRWSASAYVGLDSVDAGRGFQIIAALADRQAHGVIQGYFTQARGNFGGLPSLPSGTQVMSQVQVVRR
ncbi:MAG TPA: hypothetical protein VFJ82_21060 [Longimicrobium sp.]|nr:hypothetical protein [Longimicrobium sp.]